MKKLLTGQEMTAADHYTSDYIGIPSLVLMERASLSVADEICSRTTVTDKVWIIAGSGNNGADGLACGRILLDRGYDVTFLLLSEKAPAEGSSMAVQQNILRKYGAKVKHFSDREALFEKKPAVIVDAIFGTGLSRELTGRVAAIVDAINDYRSEHKCLVVSVDIPSGVSSDDGSVLGRAVRCDLTVTFAFYKRGHFLFPGASYCGEVCLKEIGITERSFTFRPNMFMLEEKDVRKKIIKRDPSGHKGSFGKVLLVVGSKGMCGAAILCARACAASGAGMVKIFTSESNRTILQTSLPEVMLTTYEEGESEEDLSGKITADLAWADVAAIGSGLGRGREAAILVREFAKTAAINDRLKAMIWDADALRILSEDRTSWGLLADRQDGLLIGKPSGVACVLTPHLAEFAGLCHIGVREASQNRAERVKKLADELHAVVIGKDARTIIAGPETKKLCLNTNGNAGMATAGSGDVLTGITAAMAAIIEDPFEAACTAAYIHAAAGDLTAQELGEYSMTAGDLANRLSKVFMSLA